MSGVNRLDMASWVLVQGDQYFRTKFIRYFLGLSIFLIANRYQSTILFVKLIFKRNSTGRLVPKRFSLRLFPHFS